MAFAAACSAVRCFSSAYVSPRPVRPASVATSITARSANGSCTPTEFSSGGSANATGVIATLVMRMLPLAIALVPGVRAVDQAEQPVGIGLADRVRQQHVGHVLVGHRPQEPV